MGTANEHKVILNKHITLEQKIVITNRIIGAADKYGFLERTSAYKETYTGEHKQHAKQAGISQAISEAFPESESFEGFNVRCFSYANRTRPELYNDKIKLFILGDTCARRAYYLTQYYEMNTFISEDAPIFAYLLYRISKKKQWITSISLVFPNGVGSSYFNEVLYGHNQSKEYRGLI